MDMLLFPTMSDNNSTLFNDELFQGKYRFVYYTERENKRRIEMDYPKTKFKSPDRIPIWGEWEGKIQFESRIDTRNKVEFVPFRTDNKDYGEAKCKGIHFFISVKGVKEMLELILVKSTDYKKACADRDLAPSDLNMYKEVSGYRFFEPYTGTLFPMYYSKPIRSIKGSIEALKIRFNGDQHQNGLSDKQLSRLNDILKEAKNRE